MVTYIFALDEIVIAVSILWTVLKLFSEEESIGMEKMLIVQSLCLVVVAISHFSIDKGIYGVPYSDGKIKESCAYSALRL